MPRLRVVREGHTEQEHAVLGTLITHPRTWDHGRVLTVGDFLGWKERKIFEALEVMYRDSIPVDFVSVANVARALDLKDADDVVLDLASAAVLPESIPWHVERVLDASRSRQLIADMAIASKKTAEEAATAAVDAVERYNARQAKPRGFELIRADGVPDPGPTRWLIEKIWITGGVGFIAGEPKTKKSFLSIAMAVAVASGTKLLNMFAVGKPAPVVMFNAEDRLSETKRRVAGMCNALDIRLADLDIYFINVTGMRLDSPDDAAKLRATVAYIKPALVVLDPFRNLFDGDENDSNAVTSALNPLRAIQRDYDTAVSLVHHMAKPSELKRRAGQRMRGSGAIHGWGDCNLYVELKGDVSAVEVEQRYAEACDDFGWKLRDQPTPNGDALWCEPVTIPSQEEVEEVKEAKDLAHENIVLNTIRTAPNPLSGNDIVRMLGIKRTAVLAAVASLNQRGAIEQVEREIVDGRGRKMTRQGWVARGAIT